MSYLRELLLAAASTLLVSAVVSFGQPQASSEDKSGCPQAPNYHMGLIAHAAPDYPRELFVYISVEPEHFVEKDMRALACALRNKFSIEPRFTAIILDDEDALRHTSPIHRTREFLRARRGYYRTDRTTGEEYIEYSKSRSNPIDEVKIDLRKH